MSALSVLVLVGCARAPEARCPASDEIPVVDRDGAAPEGLVQQVRQHVAFYLDAFGQDALCVDEVRLAEEARHPVTSVDDSAGYYNPATDNVVLVYLGDPRFLRHVVGHELCHGLDYTFDIVREDRDLWAPEDGDLPHGYADDYRDRQLPREVFAEYCALAPRDPLASWLQRTCAASGPARRQVLEEEVFLGEHVTLDVVQDLSVDVEERGIIVGDHVDAETGWMTPALQTMIVSTFDRVTGVGLTLHRVDVTHPLGWVEPLAVLPDVESWGHEALWGGPDGVLVGLEDGSWRRIDAEGTVHPTGLTVEAERGLDGVLMGDLAIGVTRDALGIPRFGAWDVDSGAPRDIGLPDAWASAVVHDGDALILEGEDGTWRGTPGQGFVQVSAHTALRASVADGLLGQVVLHGAARIPVLLDQDGVLHTVEEACDAPRLRERMWVIDGQPTSFSLEEDGTLEFVRVVPSLPSRQE